MTWFKVDDNFLEHAKLDAIERKYGAAAVADCVLVWLGIGTWCARQLAQGSALPDGVIDRVALRRLRFGTRDPIACAEILAEVGLLEVAAEGTAMHDWDDYQQTSAVVAANRASWKAQKTRQRQAKEARTPPHVRAGHPPMSTPSRSRSRSRSF